MKVVFTGAGHWHTRLYLEPLLKIGGHTIVGMCDPDPLAAERVAAKAGGVAAFTDESAMLESVKPDFAFVLGRHCDMAASCENMIAHGVDFAVEKPGALDAAQLMRMADAAERSGVFAAVALVMRHSPILDVLAKAAPGEGLRYASFKFIAGMVDRYVQDGVTWMLQRATTGGGCILNLGVHFVDLFRHLCGDDVVTTKGAQMSNLLAGLDIEDHGILLMESAHAACLVETGYNFPAPRSVFDMHFNLRTERHYFIARDQTHFEAWSEDRTCVVHEIPTTNMGCYPLFTSDVLRRAESGAAPAAGLRDMAAALALMEAGYRLSPLRV